MDKLSIEVYRFSTKKGIFKFMRRGIETHVQIPRAANINQDELELIIVMWNKAVTVEAFDILPRHSLTQIQCC